MLFGRVWRLPEVPYTLETLRVWVESLGLQEALCTPLKSQAHSWHRYEEFCMKREIRSSALGFETQA